MTRTARGTHRRGGGRSSFPVWWNRRLTWGKALWRRLSARPGIAHLVRAGERFSDRLGNHFAAAITYFSFLSLVPIVMVAFAAAGFVLSSRPDLLDALKDQVTTLLGSSMGDFIDGAIEQRTNVAVIALFVAAYSGLSWMGNVRDAVRAQWRPTWTRAKEARVHFLMSYVWDLVSLLSLLIAVLVTFALTAVGTAAQNLVIGWLDLDEISWLRPLFTVGPFFLAICADVLIFAWIYTILPYKAYRAGRRTLLIGSLAMAVCFEVLKAALTILVTRMATSPSGAVFGSVIGLLLFFNLVARAFLMVAAWIATGTEQDDDEAEAGAPASIPAPASVSASRAITVRGSNMSDSGPNPPPTVITREDDGARRLVAAFGSGALVGWLLGRRRR